MMKKMKILIQAMAATLTVVVVTLVAVETATHQYQLKARKLSLSGKINRITFTPVSDVSFDAMGDQSIHDWYVNDKGTTFTVFGDREAGYVIRVFLPSGSLASEFSCTGPVWEPRVNIWYITADDAGKIYAAVEWSFKSRGIIVVDSRGGLVAKLKFTDFRPFNIAVDRDRRIWVAGWEVPDVESAIPPNAEQVRVYDQSLRLLDIPVRNLRRAMYVCSPTAVDNEVMHYAIGMNEVYIFKDGKLADKLLVGEIPKLELPPEARGKDVEVRRGVKGVFKLDNYLVLGGFYTYHWKDRGVPRGSGKNFITVVNLEDSTISAELEAPEGSLTRSNMKGGLVYLSGGRQEGAYKLTRTKLIF